MWNTIKNCFKRPLRLGLSQPVDIFTAWLMIFTGILSLETAASVWVLLRTDETLHGNLVATNRAWITPDVGLAARSVRAGKPAEMRLTYSNRGREPANEIKKFNRMAMLRPDDVKSWLRENVINDQAACKANLEGHTQTLPHGDRFNVTVSSQILKDEDVAAFKDGERTFYISGCVMYRTLAGVVWTHYCRFVKREDAGGPSIGDESPAEVLLDTDYCPEGNFVR